MGDAVSSFLKLVVSSTALGAWASAVILPIVDKAIRVPAFGVPVSLVGAAAVGAGLSLFFGDPIQSRKSLFGQVTAATAFGLCAGVLAAEALSLKWAQDNIGMFVMMVSALMRWFLPSLIAKGKDVIKSFKFPSFTKSDDGGDK